MNIPETIRYGYFQINVSSKVKCKYVSHLPAIRDKNKNKNQMVVNTFSSFHEDFLLISPKLHFVHDISHIKPSQYDSTSNTKISMF